MDHDKIINSYQAVLAKEKPTAISVGAQESETIAKISNVSALSGLMDEIKLAYGLIRDSASGKYKGVSATTVSLLIGALAYLAMPIDLVPDFIPVAGWLDDAAVLTWVFAKCHTEIAKYGKTSKSRKARPIK